MTAAGGAGLTGNVTINVQGQSQLDALAKSIVVATQDVLRLASSMPTLDAAQQKQIKSMTQQVTLYTRAASLANTWASASLKAAEAEKIQASAADTLTRAITANKTALEGLTGTTQRSFDSKSRTIALSQQNAQVLLTEAQAAKTAAEAVQLQAKAQRDLATATRTQAGKGEPISDYDKARLALQNKALAARTAQQAVDNAAKADLAASTAAARLAQSSQNAAAAQQRRASAANAAASSSRASAAAADDESRAVTGSYFALYQVAAAYALISKAASSVVTGAVSTAASFQAAFNNVIRTTGLLGDTSEMAQSQVTLLKNQLTAMSEVIPVSLEDVASIAALGGQLGIQAGDIASFTDVVAKFSALTGISASNTALAFGRITNLLGVTTDQYDSLASTVLDLGTKSAATESEILAVTQSIAATGKSAGLSVPDVLGLSTAMASLKIPPELGRGTLTRLFVQISSAASDGEEGMSDYAKVLGTTAAQALALQKSDPSTFFTNLIRGLGQASANGEDLNNVLDGIGIKNARDIPVITRLAQNYNILANNIQEAQVEIAKPAGDNALAQQANLIFSGLSAKAKEFGNTFRAALANLGGSALAPLTLALQPLTALIKLFERMPAVVTGPIVAVTAFVGAMAAYRAAVAIGLAATLAFQNALAGNTATIGLRSLAIAASQTFGNGAVAARLGATAIASSNTAIASSSTATSTVLLGQTRAMAAVATGATGMSAAQLRTAASSVAAASGGTLVTASMSNAAGAYARSATTATASALASAYLAAAMELEALAGEGAAGSATIHTAALLRQEAATLATAGSTGVLAGAMGLLSKVSPIGWVTILVGAVAATAALVSHFANAQSESEQLAARAAEIKTAFLDAVGGVDSLNNAIKKDTEAAASVGTAAAGGVQQLVRHIEDLHDGTAKVTDQFETMDGALVDLPVKTQIVKYADSVLDAAHNTEIARGSQDAFGKSAGLTADQLSRQTAIIGQQTQALAAHALAVSVYGGKDSQGKDVTGILSSFEQDQIAATLATQGQTLGTVLGDAFKAGTTKGAAGLQAAFAPYLAGLNKQLEDFKAKAASLPKYDPTQGDTQTNRNALGAQTEIANTQARIDSINKLIESFKGQSGALHDAVTQDSAYGDIMKAMGVATEDMAGDTADATGALNTATAATGSLGEAAQTAAQTLETMASGFTSVLSAAFDMTSAIGETQSAVEALGTGLAENGTDFTNYTEAGRANISNLKAVITDYGAELANQVKTGEITTEAAAQQMQAYVQNLVATLASQGVDTSQIDFLVDYVNQFTSNPAILTIQADGSQAINELGNVQQAALNAGAAIQQTGVLWDDSQFRNSSDAAAHGGLTPTYASAPTASANAAEHDQQAAESAAADAASALQASQDMAAARQQEADAALAAAQADAQYQIDLKAAQAQDQAATQAAQESSQAADDGARAQKAAGSAAKKAAKDKADAAKQAEDALKREADYVQAMGGYYAKLADSATSTSGDSGKVISSLQDLGNSLAVNGNSFSQYSENGRKNLADLTGALDAYGESLNTKLQNGTITIGQAGAQFAQFAGGVKQDLLGLGVPAGVIDTLFKSLNAGNGWANTTADVSQYSGVVNKAASDSTAFGDAAKAATDKAAESAKELADYYSAVEDFFKGVSDNAFQFIDAEGAVFHSVQSLGAAIVDNGKAFNTVTEDGRSNFSALSDVFDKFGANLNVRIKGGAITAKQGAEQYAAFAAQTYNQLIKLGVKASDIAPFFKALGIDPGKTSASNAAVGQYAGVLTAAATAARAAADASSKLGDEMDKAADYASRLDDAMSTAFDRLHGLAQAQDAVTTAVRGMSDAYQANIDKIKELEDANKGLTNDQANSQAAYDAANRKYLLAVKYGQKDAAKKYLTDRNTAGDEVTNDTAQIAKNAAEAAELKKYGTSLSGNSKEAIANRASYLDLQKTMQDQIVAYAKTGASTKQVTKYTADLKRQFEAAGKTAGFSQADIKKYSRTFDTYLTVIKSVPRNISTKISASADTSSVDAALNSIPTTGTYKVTASTVDTITVVRALTGLPDRQDYRVYPVVDDPHMKSLQGALSKLPTKQNMTITPVMDTTLGANPGNALASRYGLKGTKMTVTAAADAVSAARAAQIMKDHIPGLINIAVGAANSVLSILGISIGANGSIDTPRMNVTDSYIARDHLAQRPTYNGGLAGAGLFNGGQVPGFSNGGLLTGTPPANPKQDNLLGMVSGRPIGLRSKEFVVSQPAVEYYGVGNMNAINNRQMPRSTFYSGYANGGQPGGGGGMGMSGGGNSGPIIAQLSTEDRRMLRRAIDRPIVTVLDGARVSKSQAHQNAVSRKSGAIV